MKILFIDDDVRYLSVLHRYFVAQGYQVLVAASASDGLRTARLECPGLIVLDTRLPDMDGGKAYDALRGISLFPIVIHSAVKAEADVVRSLLVGAEAYIVKPIAMEELEARLNAIIRRMEVREEAVAPSRYDDGYLVVDLSRHLIIVNDQRVQLTGIEYRILSELLRQVNQVVPREDLIAPIWGVEDPHALQYLATYMRHLRLKLEEDPSHPRYIQTVRGLGYGFMGAPDTIEPLPPVE